MRKSLVWLSLPLLLLGCLSEKRMGRAQAEVDLGVAYYKEGDTEAAIAQLREATHTDPRNWRAFNTLAITYAAKGQPELAGAAFERALKINPGEGEILVNYGAWQVAAGQPDAAVATFEAALADLDYRNTAFVLSNLSFALLQTGRTEDAILRAREAVSRMPTLCQGWLHLGLAQEKAGNADAALSAYGHLIADCPTDSVGARLRTGCIQLHGPTPEAGIDALQEVLAAAPDTQLADEARSCLRSVGH